VRGLERMSVEYLIVVACCMRFMLGWKQSHAKYYSEDEAKRHLLQAHAACRQTFVPAWDNKRHSTKG